MQNDSYTTITKFKKLLVCFWGLWWLITLWTDVIGGASYLGWITADWAPSKNYPLLVQSLAMYHPPSWFPAACFIGIIIWLCIICIAYLQAIMKINHSKVFWHKTDLAFMISLALWIALILADQLIMNYDLEANHMIQASLQFLCWFFMLLHKNPKPAK